jgi:hypothetical protein
MFTLKIYGVIWFKVAITDAVPGLVGVLAGA